jgi:hypothetical protein
VEEYWIAPALTDPAFAIWLKVDPHTGDTELDGKVATAMKVPKGTVLKHLQETTVVVANGKTQTGTSLLEVTQLERKTEPARSFAAPFECRTGSTRQSE